MADDGVNEEELEYTFTAYEIDLDYEFDAPRFVDFERDDSLHEARLAELWFESAGSCPPSPFVEKLIARDEVLKENVNISPKCKGVETMDLSEDNSDVDAEHENYAMEINFRDEGRQDKGTSSTIHIANQQKLLFGSQNLYSGLTFYNHMANNTNSENHTKLSTKKPKVTRTSTLMKPTVSQLAKQNRPFQAGYSSSQKSLFEKTSKSSANTCVIENQAAKRQKLEGGLLKKVMGTVQLQQTNFVHKAPKQDGILNRNLINTKPRINIPKDLDIKTARRVLRTQSSKDNAASTTCRFEALPLNRKILEAPSFLPKRSTPRMPEFHEFQLKTSERAMLRSSAVLKSTVPKKCNHSDKDLHKPRAEVTLDCGNIERGRPCLLNTSSKPNCYQPSQSFKALPLNKKEFNFNKEKRLPDNPPVDLFSKLSLASETQLANIEAKAPIRSITLSTKGSKENRWVYFQQGNEVKQN